jgi:hypothetical protein
LWLSFTYNGTSRILMVTSPFSGFKDFPIEDSAKKNGWLDIDGLGQSYFQWYFHNALWLVGCPEDSQLDYDDPKFRRFYIVHMGKICQNTLRIDKLINPSI